MTIDNLEMSPTFINYCNMAEAPAQLDANCMPNCHLPIRQSILPSRENGYIFRNSTPPVRSISNSSQNSTGNERQRGSAVVKKSICLNWLAGKCRFRERCWYAHRQEPKPAKAEIVPQRYADHGAMNHATYAQQRWISMSDIQRSETDPTRFARESVAAQFRAGVEALLKEDTERARTSQTVEQNNYVKAFNHHPELIPPISLLNGDRKGLIDGAAAILASLTFLKINDEFTNIKEECPFYASGVFCPLGSDCLLEHKVRTP